MKILIITSCLLGLLFLSCNKEEKNTCPDGLEEGRIIGLDFRKCACCSGWFIEVGKDTLRAFTLPEGIAIEASVNPISIPVCLSYKKATECQIWDDLIDIEVMSLE